MNETSAAIAAPAGEYREFPKFDRKTITLAFAIFAGGWLIGQQAGDWLLPWQPSGKSRPVVKFFARLAKTGLWLMLAAEQPQTANHYTNHAYRHGELNHREGW
jgi:hypothetical protein